MSKKLTTKDLFGQQTLLALTVTAALAAAGCTTDRHLGNGDPVVTPGLRTSPTASPSMGSETAPTNPMYSSSRFADTSITNGTLPASSPAGAAAIMAQHLPAVHVLGVGVDGPSVAVAETEALGQFQNPAMITNPQQTINSSISSPGSTAVGVATGAVSGDAIGGTAVNGVGVSSGVSIAATAGITATSVTPGLAPSPLAAATPTSAGAFAGTNISPTAVSSVNPAASVSSLAPALSPTVASASNVAPAVTGAVAVSPKTAGAAPIATTGSAVATRSATATAPRATAIRGARLSNAGGRVVVTPATTATTGGSSQK